MDKKELIRRLQDSPVYQASLESVDSPAEREAIANRAVDFVGGVADALIPVVHQMMASPELAELLRTELRKRAGQRVTG